VAPTEAVMTLTTCHPMYSARERYVVHATLDYWMWTADGIPVEIQGGA
jgi:sortase A